MRALALEPLADGRRRWLPRELLSAVEGGAVAEGVRTRALAVLERLLDAEARVHGLPLEELELEELGEDDTLLDVVGIAAALDALGVERVAVSPIPMPVAGGVSTAGGHGVPAPVILERIERAVRALGFAVVRVRHRGETATIEVEPGDVERLASHPDLPGALRKIVTLGWPRVEVDPGGYRRGGANARRSEEAAER